MILSVYEGDAKSWHKRGAEYSTSNLLLLIFEGCPSLPSKYIVHPIIPWTGWIVL